jgi:hypothetical protein
MSWLPRGFSASASHPKCPLPFPLRGLCMEVAFPSPRPGRAADRRMFRISGGKSYAVSSAELRECREPTREHPLNAKQTCGHLVASGYRRKGSAVGIPRGVEMPDRKDCVATATASNTPLRSAHNPSMKPRRINRSEKVQFAGCLDFRKRMFRRGAPVAGKGRAYPKPVVWKRTQRHPLAPLPLLFPECRTDLDSKS